MSQLIEALRLIANAEISSYQIDYCKGIARAALKAAEAQPFGLSDQVARELERLANDPPISGNHIARQRVLMAAANVREFGLEGGAAEAQPAPVAWIDGQGHPHHISAVQTITDRRLYGPWKPLYAAPVAAAQPERSGRQQFEAWMKDDSTLSLDRDAHGYTDFSTELMWHSWQAAQKANAPGGALVGEADARRPGLAGPDSACQHEFALQPSSSIHLCQHCGVSQTAAKKAAQPVAQPFRVG